MVEPEFPNFPEWNKKPYRNSGGAISRREILECGYLLQAGPGSLLALLASLAEGWAHKSWPDASSTSESLTREQLPPRISKPWAFTDQCLAQQGQLSVVWHCFIPGIDADIDDILPGLKPLPELCTQSEFRAESRFIYHLLPNWSFLHLFSRLLVKALVGLQLKVVWWIDPPLKTRFKAANNLGPHLGLHISSGSRRSLKHKLSFLN